VVHSGRGQSRCISRAIVDFPLLLGPLRTMRLAGMG